MSLNKKFRSIVAFVTAVCFSTNVYASSSAVNSFYNYASSGNTSKIRYLVQNMGYDIDTKGDDGNSAWCMAKKNNDTLVMNTLERMGANPNQMCGVSWGVVGGVVGAVAVVGGVVAAASGGGGSSSSSSSGGGGSSSGGGSEGVNCPAGYVATGQECYADLNCNALANSDGQFKDTCHCINGFSGTMCDTCNGSVENGICYSGGSGGNSCPEGYVATEGSCYPDLNCNSLANSNGQFKDSCHCINGFSGTMCDMCDGSVKDGVCYPNIRCSHNGVQVGDVCDCSLTNNYTGDYCETCDGFDNGTTCFPKIDCGVNGRQFENMCVCLNGYSGEACNVCDGLEVDGVCYKELDCNENGGVQVGDKCECYEGYEGFNCAKCKSGYDNHGKDLTKCYLTLDCAHGEQEGGVCKCETGYEGDLCNICAPGYDGYGSTTACYPALDCGEHGHQVENTCICDSGYERNGMGMCVEISSKAEAKIIIDNNDNYQLNSKEGGIQVEYADLYGRVYDKTAFSDYKLDQNNLYMNVLINNEYIDTIDNTRSLILTQFSDGHVYGLKSDNADNIYLSYLDLSERIGLGNQTTSLTIANGAVILGEETLVSGGNGNAYGVYAENGNIFNMAQNIAEGVENNVELFSEIFISSLGSGNVYGMYSENGNVNNGLYDVNTGENVVNLDAKILILGEGTGNTYGLYAGNGSIINSGSVGVGNAEGAAYGLYASGTGDVTNLGEVVLDIASKSNLAYGIYSNGGNVVNAQGAKIEVESSSEDATVYGIYANGGTVTNAGSISVSGNKNAQLYGIYAANGATVNNTGTIMLNGQECISCDGSESFGNHIVLDGGASLVNFGLIDYSTSLDLDSFGGSVSLGKNGVYSGESISGTLNVDSSVVADGFADKYVETSALKSSNVEVNAVSNSVMFEASVEKEADGASSSVVLNRKSFEELLGGSSVSKYLEENYQQGNNEQLYSTLKKQGSLSSFATAVASDLGYGLLPNFAQENMRVFKSLSNTLNEELFATSGKERSMVGYDYLYQERDTKGTITGYENHSNTMYFMYDREHNNLLRSGFGMAITQFSSDYEDDSSREELMVQALIPVSYVKEQGLSYASIARIGYGDGEYERVLSGDKYESDLTSWLYGLSNVVKYNINLGFAELEPVMELNLTGYYQDKIEETEGKRGSITTEAENNMSVEAGLGLNVRKEVKFNQRSKLKLKAGAMYYHEYAHPYHSLHASQVGMSGKYLIRDEENIYDKDRGVINAGIDYEYKPFTIYGNFRQFIEEENPFEVNAGIKFNF